MGVFFPFFGNDSLELLVPYNPAGFHPFQRGIIGPFRYLTHLVLRCQIGGCFSLSLQASSFWTRILTPFAFSFFHGRPCPLILIPNPLLKFADGRSLQRVCSVYFFVGGPSLTAMSRVHPFLRLVLYYSFHLLYSYSF